MSAPLHLLFICARNRLRSPTAEQVFSIEGFETQSAGVAADADVPLDADAIEWADVLLFMESAHRAKAMRRFAKQMRGKRVACLNIPDRFSLMDDQLVMLLWERVSRAVPELAGRRESERL